MGRFNRTTRLRTARFPMPGAAVAGLVLDIKDVPVPEFADGRIIGPKFDVSGVAVTQADVTVQAADGEETVIHTGTGIAIAIAQALVKSKLDDLNVGDIITVTYVSDEDADEGIPTKVYEAEVTRPKSVKKA